jgi:hypothetical protein
MCRACPCHAVMCARRPASACLPAAWLAERSRCKYVDPAQLLSATQDLCQACLRRMSQRVPHWDMCTSAWLVRLANPSLPVHVCLPACLCMSVPSCARHAQGCTWAVVLATNCAILCEIYPHLFILFCCEPDIASLQSLLPDVLASSCLHSPGLLCCSSQPLCLQFPAAGSAGCECLNWQCSGSVMCAASCVYGHHCP